MFSGQKRPKVQNLCLTASNKEYLHDAIHEGRKYFFKSPLEYLKISNEVLVFMRRRFTIQGEVVLYIPFFCDPIIVGMSYNRYNKMHKEDSGREFSYLNVLEFEAVNGYSLIKYDMSVGEEVTQITKHFLICDQFGFKLSDFVFSDDLEFIIDG